MVKNSITIADLLERRISEEVTSQVERMRADLEEDIARRIGEVKSPSPLMSRREACEYLGVSFPTLHAMMNSGALRYEKVGRATRFHRSDVEKVLKGGRA